MDKPEVKIHKRQMSVHKSKSNVQAMCFHTWQSLMDKPQVKILPTKNKHTMVVATTETSFHMQQRTTILQNMRIILGSVTEIGFFCFKKLENDYIQVNTKIEYNTIYHWLEYEN